MNFANLDLNAIWNKILAWSPTIVGGILVLIIGFWIVNMITKIIGRSLDKSGVDKDLIPFMKSLIINLKYVESTHENSQGLSISMTGTPKRLPVARPNIRDLKKQMALLHSEVGRS